MFTKEPEYLFTLNYFNKSFGPSQLKIDLCARDIDDILLNDLKLLILQKKLSQRKYVVLKMSVIKNVYQFKAHKKL